MWWPKKHTQTKSSPTFIQLQVKHIVRKSSITFPLILFNSLNSFWYRLVFHTAIMIAALTSQEFNFAQHFSQYLDDILWLLGSFGGRAGWLFHWRNWEGNTVWIPIPMHISYLYSNVICVWFDRICFWSNIDLFLIPWVSIVSHLSFSWQDITVAYYAYSRFHAHGQPIFKFDNNGNCVHDLHPVSDRTFVFVVCSWSIRVHDLIFLIILALFTP